MNDQAYLKALRKALGQTDKATRDEIIREIESHVAESGDKNSLLQRFGTPEALAQEYLGHASEKTQPPSFLSLWGKRILAGIGLGSLIIFFSLIMLMNWFGRDEFDFANENASELTAPSRHWSETADTPMPALSLEQSKVAIYWHDSPAMRWSCRNFNATPDTTQHVLTLKHDHCLVYLPKQAQQINANQAELILVSPKADVSINLMQSQFRFAANSRGYQFNIDARQSRVVSLESTAGADVEITIKALESDLRPY